MRVLRAQPLFPCLSLVSLVLRVTRWRGEVTTSQGRRDRSEPRVMDEENEPRVTVVVLLRLVSLGGIGLRPLNIGYHYSYSYRS